MGRPAAVQVPALAVRWRERFQKARAVVLSRTARNAAPADVGEPALPQGLANSSGIVGEYLMYNYNSRASASSSTS